MVDGFGTPEATAAERCEFSFVRGINHVRGNGALEQGIYPIGAPEMLQPYLGQAGFDTSAVWLEITTQSVQLTDRGLRVLLIAHHPDPALLHDQGDESRLPDAMQPIGLISLSDELRAEAKETLQRFRPLTAYLSKKMGVPFEAVAIDTVDFTRQVETLDFTHTNSLLYVIMNRNHGVEILAAEKSGSLGARARGLIIALKKSGSRTSRRARTESGRC